MRILVCVGDHGFACYIPLGSGCFRLPEWERMESKVSDSLLASLKDLRRHLSSKHRMRRSTDLCQSVQC